jgi:hypothetical protein
MVVRHQYAWSDQRSSPFRTEGHPWLWSLDSKDPAFSKRGIIRKAVRGVLLLGKSLGREKPSMGFGIDCDQTVLQPGMKNNCETQLAEVGPTALNIASECPRRPGIIGPRISSLAVSLRLNFSVAL